MPQPFPIYSSNFNSYTQNSTSQPLSSYTSTYCDQSQKSNASEDSFQNLQYYNK